MALSTIDENFPNQTFRGRRTNPSMYTLLDYMENQMDRHVGHLFRRLPDLMLGYDEEYASVPGTKKRKVQKADLSKTGESRIRVVPIEKDGKLNISVDCTLFSPDEISVKIVENRIHVNARHENEDRDSYELYKFAKVFDMPEGSKAEEITSRFSQTGQLTIEIPLKQGVPAVEKTVPVVLEAPTTSDNSTETSGLSENATKNTQTAEMNNSVMP